MVTSPCDQHVAVVRGGWRRTTSRTSSGRFGEVIAVLDEQGLHPTGAPFGRYRTAEGAGLDVEAGFPCSDVVKRQGRVRSSELPGGRVARTVHVGAYGGVGEAYEAAVAWLTEEGYVTVGTPWESHLDGPEVPEPRTEVFVPCEHAHPVRR